MSDYDSYDARRRDNRPLPRHREPPGAADTRRRDRRDRSRSRSRSPDTTSAAAAAASAVPKQQQQLEERRARMARLREENTQEEEEQSAAAKDQQQQQHGDKKMGPQDSIVEVNQEELEGLDEEEQMRMLLGFTGNFGSTKGEKVDDNHNSSSRGVAAKNKARKYRQYMNRKNGFNRPLEKMD
jgi:U4/U6.U5 tri-snRNP-associated protein 3